MKQTVQTPKSTGRVLSGIMALSALLSGTAFGWSISGTVKSNTGATLSGVAVTVMDSAAYKTTTDNNGNFSLQPPTAIDRGTSVRSASVLIDGHDLVVQGMADGALGLSLVNASGRSIWTAEAVSIDGSARSTLPTNLIRGAIFLRIKHARGVSYQTVTSGAKGIEVAARALASYPVLQFKLAGYDDATYAMTSETVSGITVTMSPPATCELGTSFKWKDFGKPIAEPKNGWLSIKDYSIVRFENKYFVYMTNTPASGGFEASYMAPFADFSQAASAAQYKLPNGLPGVAPQIMYFAPKKTWVFTTQWCQNYFCYTTGSDIANPADFAAKNWTEMKPLLKENITDSGMAPIDQTVICDDDNCFLFYADDNGNIYRGSMPKANFPGEFKGTERILKDERARLFEAVEVYKLKGQKKYLMLVECGWTRYFRAFTATDLGGTWTALGSTREYETPFAGAKNVTNGWSNDISHGEIVRSGYDEYKEIDPCNLQMIYQGLYAGGNYSSLSYDSLPYRMGLITRE